jgi:hypothetical protein
VDLFNWLLKYKSERDGKNMPISSMRLHISCMTNVFEKKEGMIQKIKSIG